MLQRPHTYCFSDHIIKTNPWVNINTATTSRPSTRPSKWRCCNTDEYRDNVEDFDSRRTIWSQGYQQHFLSGRYPVDWTLQCIYKILQRKRHHVFGITYGYFFNGLNLLNKIWLQIETLYEPRFLFQFCHIVLFIQKVKHIL